MLNLNQSLTLKSTFFFLLSFSIVSLSITYLSNYLSAHFYILWTVVFLILLIIFVIVLYILKRKNDKILSDTQKIIDYLEEINDKNYEAILKTKHFSEFLQIELLLKNIIKRLHKKDKKK